MNWKKTFAIVRREYVERVRTKAFWFSTLIIPIFFLVYIGIQISASRRTGGERHVVVVDPSGALYQPLVQELAAVEAEQKEKHSEIEGTALGRDPVRGAGGPGRRQGGPPQAGPRQEDQRLPPPRSGEAREGEPGGRVLLDHGVGLHLAQPARARVEPHPHAAEDAGPGPARPSSRASSRSASRSTPSRSPRRAPPRRRAPASSPRSSSWCSCTRRSSSTARRSCGASSRRRATASSRSSSPPCGRPS